MCKGFGAGSGTNEYVRSVIQDLKAKAWPAEGLGFHMRKHMMLGLRALKSATGSVARCCSSTWAADTALYMGRLFVLHV